MTQISLFPPPPPVPGTAEILKPFGSFRDAADYAQSLPLDLWDVRIWFDSRSTYYVKAVRQ